MYSLGSGGAKSAPPPGQPGGAFITNNYPGGAFAPPEYTWRRPCQYVYKNIVMCLYNIFALTVFTSVTRMEIIFQFSYTEICQRCWYDNKNERSIYHLFIYGFEILF